MNGSRTHSLHDYFFTTIIILCELNILAPILNFYNKNLNLHQIENKISHYHTKLNGNILMEEILLERILNRC